MTGSSLARRLADAVHAFRSGHSVRDDLRIRRRRLHLLTVRAMRSIEDRPYLSRESQAFARLLEDVLERFDRAAEAVLACKLEVYRVYGGTRSAWRDHVRDEAILHGTYYASDSAESLGVVSGQRHRQLNAGLYQGPVHHFFDRKLSFRVGNRHLVLRSVLLGLTSGGTVAGPAPVSSSSRIGAALLTFGRFRKWRKRGSQRVSAPEVTP